ncbi:MAG: hypothetical protein ABSE49_31055 [Polyangiaceae bacterium]|jgi:hypothetical protein
MNWEIYDGQLQRGPMPDEGVFEAIRGGLPRNAYVRQAGASDWTPIDSHPMFGSAMQNRGAPVQWTPPPPPPPPPLVGAPPPLAPEVQRPPPGTAYAVSAPTAGQRVRRKLAAGGCLVQGLGSLALLGSGFALYTQAAALPIVAATAGIGLALLFGGGLLGLKWVCGSCKQPVARRGVFMCPSCRASFT